MNNENVYIIDALRTPLGRANGRLSAVSLSGLVRMLLEPFVEKYGLGKSGVDEVIIGNAVSAGAGQNFTRKAVIDAGLPDTTPAYMVNNVCASGLQAVLNARQAIVSGEADFLIAGGAESVSHMPGLVFKKRHDVKKMKGLTESLMHDGLWCSVTDRWMGLLCEDMARKESISKKEQDDYAFQSYQKAAQAAKDGIFSDEIIPLRLGGGKICREDETIRHGITREIFDTFESAFEVRGSITAANSAAPCDGAAGLLLASGPVVQRMSLQPLARIVAGVSVAGKAKDVFRLGRKAVTECLRKSGLSSSEIDLFEINEAFAAQMVLMQRDMRLPEHKVNIFGGDIAMGHPLGVAGVRCLVTLVHALKRKKKRYGLVCACLGGGGALATLVERHGF